MRAPGKIIIETDARHSNERATDGDIVCKKQNWTNKTKCSHKRDKIEVITKRKKWRRKLINKHKTVYALGHTVTADSSTRARSYAIQFSFAIFLTFYFRDNRFSSVYYFISLTKKMSTEQRHNRNSWINDERVRIYTWRYRWKKPHKNRFHLVSSKSIYFIRSILIFCCVHFISFSLSRIVAVVIEPIVIV